MMIGYIVFGVIVLLLLILVIKAACFTDKTPPDPEMSEERVHTERAITNLSKVIQIKTISHVNPADTDWDAFTAFHNLLETAYPLVHQHLKKEHVSTASLLFSWEGKQKNLEPIALLSHMDVVPVTAGTEQDWTHPPFAGEVADGHIWGRGAMDMKHHLIAVMESVETLLEEGYQPERSVYLCFGHNEEIVAAADTGAGDIAKLLKERGVHLDSVLDEGGILLPVHQMGIHATFATIGTTEKGYADFKITVNAKGGHSSNPPRHGAIYKLSQLITRLEKHQFKVHFLPTTRALIENAGRHMPLYLRLIVGNLWLWKPLILAVMKQIPPTASIIRTTIAVTQAEGSPQANVLPQKASITVNCRILPGESVASTQEHLRRVINDDTVTIELLKCKEPSPLSPMDSRAYTTIERLCRQCTDDAVAVPLLVMGGTDSYHYESICKNVYRFSPFIAGAALIGSTHGTNERLPVDSMKGAVAFFKRYIKIMTKE